MSRINEIRDRLLAISPAPWEWDGERGNLLAGPPLTDEEFWERHPTSHSYNMEPIGDCKFREAIIQTDSGVYPPRGANREFIANAPSDVEFLLNVLDWIANLRDPPHCERTHRDLVAEALEANT